MFKVFKQSGGGMSLVESQDDEAGACALAEKIASGEGVLTQVESTFPGGSRVVATYGQPAAPEPTAEELKARVQELEQILGENGIEV